MTSPLAARLGHGIHNNDPEWRRITDFNLDEYSNADWVVDRWKEHAKSLEVELPDDEELWRRYWRLIFTTFVQRTLKNNGQPKHYYRNWGTEEYILNNVYPWMKPLWLTHRVKLTASLPTVQTLRKRWWYNKRHDCVMRWKGGRKRHPRHKIRLDTVLGKALWCRHRECWKLRFLLLFYAIVILFLIYVLIEW